MLKSFGFQNFFKYNNILNMVSMWKHVNRLNKCDLIITLFQYNFTLYVLNKKTTNSIHRHRPVRVSALPEE